MNAPTNADRAFRDTSSATTSGKERGVALLLADAEAETIEDTANVAITNMLEATIDNSASIGPSALALATIPHRCRRA